MENKDLIDFLQLDQHVCEQKRCALAHKTFKRAHDFMLCQRIEVRSWFIGDPYWCVAEQGAGDGKTLPFTL